MGRYVDWAFVVSKYPRTERSGPAEEINSFYIPYAEAELEGRLGPYFTTPFSDNNVTVKELAADLTYLRLGLMKDADHKRVKGEVDARIKRLIGGDEAMATIDGTIVQAGGEVVWSDTQGYHPIFGVDDPLDWNVDSSRLQDLEDDRDG
ncbi:MAG TPA: hypothetical protein VKA48_09930 [Gammaproteobacteria bacterium]|nr:hypothetical protein [Gammaproteobacteria bacterium]